MIELLFNRVATFAMVLAVLSVPGLFTSLASAQQRQPPPVVLETDETGRDEGNQPISALEEEIRAKRAIKYAEKEYQENLDRARDLSELGAAVVNSFKAKNGMSHDDLKKLEKIEKLAKGIRRAAGGSEDDTEMEKPPRDMVSAVSMLGDLSQSLKRKVEKTPKHVISAAVIDEANVLLELIRIVRTLTAKV